jgi:hypothetical protein
MDIFATMSIKKGMAFVFIALFLLARIQPVMPSFKALSSATHQLISHNISFFSVTDEHSDSGQDTGDTEDKDSKDGAEKDTDKDFGKSLIDYHKMILNNTIAVVFENGSKKTLFHLYRSGKVRNHINEVFRPPLV